MLTFNSLLAVVLITTVTVSGILIAVSLATRGYRRKQSAVFAGLIVRATTDQVRGMLLDLQNAVSVEALTELRNRVDRMVDEQRVKGGEAEQKVCEEILHGAAPSPLSSFPSPQLAPPTEELKE